ncbi:P-loop containing nucleoside triphosphate hydrolase protein [Chytriomyces cf. hyalinus JEL632]|nr:P-loop containing nucleoside triphosphate hydrolase protein [Chytriomyces cf. hyalinus JEL632]
MKRYPKLKEPAASALSMMDTDKIQYPLVEIIVVEIVSKLLGKKSARSVPGAKPSQTANTPKTKRKPGKPANPGPEEAEPDSDEQAPNRGVLIFMPGFAEIATLHELLLQNTVVRQGTNNGKLCMALHSTLSSEEQMRVFNRPPDGSVKIVIATNVAETSITIDDVVFVIDCGKMKQTQFDPMKGMASLEECWVSRANATQRCGRAGRVQSGTCIHLFTSHKFTHHMIEQQPPEIHRTPLEQICLRIKILPFLKSPIAQVLQQVVEPPSPEAVQAAINTLCTLRALAKDETLTPLGFHLGRLPVDVRIGKLILFGSIFGCLDSVLTIASAMSVKSPFVAPFEKRFMADVKKQEFATGVSDHLTLLTAYNTWLVARRDGFPAERAFLYDNFLSGKTLNMIASVKRQLTELLSDIGFIKTRVRAKDMERKGGRNSDGVADAIGEAGMRADHSELIKAVLVSALYPNVIKIENPPPKGGGMKGKGPSAQDLKLWVQNDEAVFIHPTSVNHKVGKYPTKFLVYHEKVKTSKVYIRDCSSVSPFALAFFGGRLIWDRQRNLLKLDEGWIQFAAGEKEAAVIEATRTAFDELLQMKIENPELDVSTTDLVREIISLVTRNGGN